MTVPPDDPYRGMTHTQYLEAWMADQVALDEFFHDSSSLDEARRERAREVIPDMTSVPLDQLADEIARISRRLLGGDDGTD